MKNYLARLRDALTGVVHVFVTLMALLAVLATVGCASNGGVNKIETSSKTVATNTDGTAVVDAKGNPAFNETNLVARVSVRQNALAATSAVRDFQYDRTNSPLGDASIKLGSSDEDAKIDPELVKAIVQGLLDRLIAPVPVP